MSNYLETDSFLSTLSLTSRSTSLSSLSSTFYLQAIDLAWLPSDPAAQRGKENRLQDGSSRDDVDRGRPHWLPFCVFVLLCADLENTACFPRYWLPSPSLFATLLPPPWPTRRVQPAAPPLSRSTYRPSSLTATEPSTIADSLCPPGCLFPACQRRCPQCKFYSCLSGLNG